MPDCTSLTLGRTSKPAGTDSPIGTHMIMQDIRFSFRLMRKRPGMTFVVFAALILGIGLNIAIFSVVNAVLLRPLPISEPDRLVWLRGKNIHTGSPLATSYPDFLDWRAQNHSFQAMAAMHPFSPILSGLGPPETLKASSVSAPWFKVWDGTSILGRDFTQADDEPAAARIVILNHAFWQRKFGGDPGVFGKSLVLDGQPYTIVGVLQPTKLLLLDDPDVYVTNGPMLNPRLMERDTYWFFVNARLKPTVTRQQAQGEMETIASRLSAQFPDTHKEVGTAVISVAENLTSDGRKPLSLLILASSLIFLLAAINVLTVSLATTFERGQELSIRLALGAPRSALLRQLLVQAAAFATIGAALGLGFAKLGLTFFLHRFPNLVLRFRETTIDMRVIAVTLGLTFLTTLLAGLVPALYVFKLKIGTELRGTWTWFAPHKFRFLGRGVLIVSQVALASGLSLVSGLLIKSFYQVEKIDLGFDPHHVFSFQISPPPTRYKEPDKQIGLYKGALAKLAGLPGMESVSGTSGLPLTPQGLLNTLEVDADSPLHGQQVMVEDEAVLPGFLRAMRLPLLQGRDFTEADHDGAPPVIIIDNLLAAKCWPGQNPIGKHIRMSLLSGLPYRWLEVVGVVRQIKHFGGPEGNVRWMQVYVPQYQDPTPALSFVVNTTLPEAATRSAAEKALHDLDKDMPVEKFQTMDAYFDGFLSGRKVGLLLLTNFAAIGIALGMIGIYGVVANIVAQRRRELAIRLALGSTHFKIMVLVTRFGFLTALAGILIGSAIVMSLTRLLASQLYGVTALDPVVYILSVALLILLSVIASAVPAIRLLRFNIQEILRQ
jgi:putative ABC transport system permease protein